MIEIKGVGPLYDKQFASAGIKTAIDLLQKGKTPQGRKEIAEKTKISESLILRLAGSIDLLRIKGVGPGTADLLRASGADTMKRLANSDPEGLVMEMAQINDKKNLLKKTPTLKKVEGWIRQANTLPNLVELPTNKRKGKGSGTKSTGKASGEGEHLKVFLHRMKERRNMTCSIEDRSLVRGNYQMTFDPAIDLDYLKKLKA